MPQRTAARTHPKFCFLERTGLVKSSLQGAADSELDDENKRLAERMCRVGSPRGPEGTIEYVYRGRRGAKELRARVLMEGGTVRHVDLLEIYVW